MLRPTRLCLILLACAAANAHGQRGGFPDDRRSGGADEQDKRFGSPAEEMRYRAAVRHEESSHKEMLGRAAETTRLAKELSASYESRRSLAAEDLKRLERLEKLARKIRGGAGGSDDDAGLENPPGGLGPAVARLSEVTEKLNANVQKTSRMVVSACVIEHTNELIELVRHIRGLVQK